MNKNLLNLIKMSLLNLRSPVIISYWWNFWSLLGMLLIIQIISEFFLSLHYC